MLVALLSSYCRDSSSYHHIFCLRTFHVFVVVTMCFRVSRSMSTHSNAVTLSVFRTLHTYSSRYVYLHLYIIILFVFVCEHLLFRKSIVIYIRMIMYAPRTGYTICIKNAFKTEQTATHVL